MIVSPWQCPLLLPKCEAIPVLVCSLTQDSCAPIMLCPLPKAIAFYYRALSAGAEVVVFPSKINFHDLKHYLDFPLSWDTTTYLVGDKAILLVSLEVELR